MPLITSLVTACLMEGAEQQWLGNACEATNGKCFALVKGKDQGATLLGRFCLAFGDTSGNLVMCNTGTAFSSSISGGLLHL